MIIAPFPPRDGKYYDCQCARCGSSCDYQHCHECEDGYSHHDCGDDCCCCAYPEPNVVCEQCHGHGGWWHCLSSYAHCSVNPLPGRDDVPRGKIEWFPEKENA